MTRNFLTFLTLSLLFSVGMTACGGGGGGGSSSTLETTPADAAPPPSLSPPDTTGVVAIAIKDAPTDEFLRIELTVTRVELLGEDGPVVVFDGEETIDLLALEKFYDLLAVSDQVPVGEYSKIRLRVSRILLIKDDGTGGETSIDADIPANGKIDLNPKGSFFVTADTALLIEIDLDAKKSIHVVGTGSGRYKFRPVVFVDIQEQQLLNGLVRAHGVIGEIADDDSYFELCEVKIQFTSRSIDNCVIVNLIADETSIFDENGDPIDVDDIRNETPPVEATVYGIAIISNDQKHEDFDEDDEDEDEEHSDDDTVRMVQINAIVVQLGPNSAAQQLDGTVLENIDDRNLFPFDIEPGQGFTDDSIVTTLLQPTTRILSSDLEPLDRNAIVKDARAAIAGVFQVGDETLYKSTLIILDDDAGEDDERRAGDVLRVEEDVFYLAEEELAIELCVEPTEDARFFYFENDKGLIQDDGLEDMDARLEEGPLNSTVFGEQIEGQACFNGNLIFYYRPDEEPPEID
jgi:hypothetical protein